MNWSQLPNGLSLKVRFSMTQLPASGRRSQRGVAQRTISRRMLSPMMPT